MIINILLILFAVLSSGLIISVHELSHFFTAGPSGIHVNEFAIGMGPTLFHSQKGETQYSLRLLPVGGYCAMEGEDESSEDDQAFDNKPVWRRIIVIRAGAVTDILSGIVLMMILLVQQPMLISTTITQFAEGSALQKTSTQADDQLYSIDGYRMRTDRDLSFSLATVNPQSIDISVVRKGEKLTFRDAKMNTRQNGDKQVVVPDFYVSGIERNPIMLIQKSGTDTVPVVRTVWHSLVGLVTGQFGLNDMAGSIGATDAISQAVSMGPKEGILPATNNIVMMMMMIIANLGVVNLSSLPALDGGCLIFLLIGLVCRHPINLKYGGWVHAAGFVFLITSIVIITYSDVLWFFIRKGLGAQTKN